jgi:hypothetical protein
MKRLYVITIIGIFFSISFKSNATLNTPVFKWFDNGDTIYSPHFGPATDQTTGIDIYRFQIDTSPNFNSPLLHDTLHNRYYYVTPKYPLGSKIYVRAKYYTSTDSSDWNQPWYVWVSDKMKLSQPADGTNGSFKYLSWSNYEYPAYQIMIDTTPAFNSSLLYNATYTNLNITRIQWDSFLFNTKYYWKVRALGTIDSTKWSDIWAFTYSITPSITSPPLGTNYQIRSASARLGFGDPGMCKIYYQLSKDPSFSTIDREGILTKEGTYNFGYVHQLEYAERYFTRLKFTTKVDSTNWAVGGSLYTLVPRITDPYNNKTIHLGGEYVSWYGDSDDLDTFQVQIDTSPNFTSPLLDSFSTKLSLYFIPESINTTFYARVRAMHPKDTSDWSASRTFSTAGINHYSLFYYPKDNEADVEPIFQYMWANSLYKMPYIEVQLDTNKDFSSGLRQKFIGNEVTPTRITPEYLLFGQTYYWSFRFGANGDTTAWSDTFSFTTTNAKVTNTFPPNGARNWGVQTNLSIKDPKIDGIEFYIYQLDTTPNFNSLVLQMGVDSVLETIETDGPFYLGQEYYWRVAPAHRYDTADWGDIWNFQSHTTFLYKPDNNAVNQNTSVKLDWYGDSDLKGYLLQIDTSENFNTAEINVTDGFNSEYTVNNLINGKKYYWRVRPYHEFDTGGWYEVYSFTVKSLPALQQPLLYKPNNYKTDVVYKNGIKFDWEYNSEQGIKYNLQVAKTSDFSNPLADLNLTYYSTTLSRFRKFNKVLLAGKIYSLKWAKRPLEPDI